MAGTLMKDWDKVKYMKFEYEMRVGTFIRRPNRFIAHILLDGEEVIAHVPNTGRMKELLPEGVEVAVSHHPDPKRKTKYELRMVRRHGCWVSIDSQLPNKIVEEGILDKKISEIDYYPEYKREVKYGNSRFDFKLWNGDEECFVEVKGVTLEDDGWGYFPDAPTERGTKHVNELIEAVGEGKKGVILFLIQHTGIEGFTPNWRTDRKFAETLVKAQNAGVDIIAYKCIVNLDEVSIEKSIPIEIDNLDRAFLKE